VKQAVAAGFTIKNIPTGPGDTFNAQAVYTHGATRYNIQDLASQFGAVQVFGGSNNPFAFQSVAVNAAPDTVFVTGGNQHAITTYGGQFGYNHNWNPFWNTGFYGAAAAVRYDDFSKLAICGLFGNGGFSGGTFSPIFGLDGSGANEAGVGGGICNPNYEIYQAGVITRWTPVKGLTFSGDFTWQHIQQHNEGLILGNNASFFGVSKPIAGTAYELRNQDNVLLLLRAQRNW
jgi:hypothetical protein